MVVEASGEDETGSPIRARWALWAEANAGPSTPAAPAAALVRGMVEGWAPPVGAYACAGLLTLGQIERELAGLPIRTRIDQSHPEQPALFRRLLGRRFDALPPAVRRVHAGAAPAVFHGHAVARAGHSVGARLAGRVLGLPPSGRSEVEVQITPDGSGETWRRRFGAARFASRLVSRSEPGVFEERFGPLRFAFELNATSRGVRWTPIGWSFAGLPLPRALAPRLHARAEEADGAYRFSVAAGHPWFGLLFAYRGRLA
jgi:hypothetical protein